LWLHSLKVAQLLRSAACLHTNQSRSYLNHLVLYLVFGAVPPMLILSHKSPVFWGLAAQRADGDFIVRVPGFTSSAFLRTRVATPKVLGEGF